MRSSSKLFVVAAFGLICVACSTQHDAPPPPVASSAPSRPVDPSAPPVSAVPMHLPTSGTPSISPPHGPTLSDAMRRPSFEKSFAAVEGASSLPAWVRTGGVATPSTKVQVDGKTMWLAHACETAACRDSQLFLLIDPAAHTIQGLFVEASGSAKASVQKFTWVGKPDTAEQAFLKDQLGRG